MGLEPSTIDPVIARIIQLMETKCIRLNGSVANWSALFDQDREAIRRSDSVKELEARVNAVLTRGGLSHVAFFHESAQGVPARYAICATFCQAETPDGPRWIFQDVHEGGPAHGAGLRPGDVLRKADGVDARPPVVATFSLGVDSVLTVQGVDGGIRDVRVVLPKADPKGKGKGKPPMAEPDSLTYRRVNDGVGYLRVAFFPGATGERFARHLNRALEDLADCTRLLVDLRGNLGGFIGSLRLMSCMTPGRVPVGYSLTRLGEDRGLRREQLACIDKLPSSTFERLKMFVRFKFLHRDRSLCLVTEGLGPRPFHGRIAVLVNEHTASAAEMVAAFASENKLATVIGSRTAGQVLGGANFRVGEGFLLRVPAAGWYTWQGAMVEGTGVRPDFSVPLSVSELRQGRDNQLAAAIEAMAAI